MLHRKYLIFRSPTLVLIILSLDLPTLAIQQTTTSFRGQAVLVADSLYQHTVQENEPYPSTVTFKIPNNDTLSIKLRDKSGNLLYQKNFGLTRAGGYAIGFTGIDTSGLCFITISLGATKATRMIMLRADSPPPFVRISCPEGMESKIDGNWQSSYSQDYKPPIRPQAESQEMKYKIEHLIRLNLAKGGYEIVWQARINGKAETKRFNGCYEVMADTLRLYKSQSNQLWHAFKYSCSDDSLTLNYFPKIIDKATGLMAIPSSEDPMRMSLKLIGKYERINKSK